MTVDLELSVLQQPSEGLGYIAGFAITEQLLIAAGGTSRRCPTVIASSNARDFAVRKTPRQLGLRDVLAVGDVIWACGEYGQLAMSRDRGATWKLLDTGTDACLFALALAPDGAVWVVGDHGYVARVVADRLERIELGTSARLASVYAVKDDIVVLGFDGALYRWHRGEVARAATGSTKALTALAITRLGTWVVVGDGGFIARSPDGAWWTRVASGVELDLEASCACPDGKLVAVGDRGLILISADDGRRWQAISTGLAHHLWAVERFGGGVLIGGDDGLIAKLAPPGDQTWQDRADMFGSSRPLDSAFSAGADGFIANGLAKYLAAIGGGQPARDRAASARRVTRELFAEIYGVAMPPELVALLAAVEGRDPSSIFAELRLDARVVPDARDGNLFEARVLADQEAPHTTGLVEAFCGAFAIGSRRSGDAYFMELYEWDGPRQILHFDLETHAFTGVVADSLDSLVYLSALARARELRQISDEAFAAGVRELRGKVAPAPSSAIGDHALAPLDAKRRDTEFFFYRSRWICALLDGRSDLSAIPGLFNADFNQVVPPDQLPARYEACEKLIPIALYSMWRAFLFDEPELEPYLAIGRRHRSRLVRDAAGLLDELRAGRNELGRIRDVRAHLAAFRALDLGTRHPAQRELAARGRGAESRVRDVAAELASTPRAGWTDLAWRWLDDGVAHRVLLGALSAAPDLTAQLAALEALHDAPDCDRRVMLPRLARELAPELEAVLAGSLVRGDCLGDDAFAASGDGDAGEDALPSLDRVRSALALTERALRLAPDDDETQFTHAMLLLDADRFGLAGKLDELIAALPSYAAANQIHIAVRMSEQAHPRFGDIVDAMLGVPPERIAGDARFGAYGDLDDDLLVELGRAVLARAPERFAALVPRLPSRVDVLAALATHAVQAGRGDDALALYERLLALPVPRAADERASYVRALNNACVQAHAAKAYDVAVAIADRAQPVAHENPYIFHSAACAYAAVGDYAKAFEQVKLAVEHDYEHLSEVEVDTDLGPLLEWPEFKALFRDWHARQEGN